MLFNIFFLIISFSSVLFADFVRFNNLEVVKQVGSNLLYDDRSSSQLYSPTEAVEYCTNLNVAEQNWRVPTFDEIFSIIQYKRGTKEVSTEFHNIQDDNWYLSFSEKENVNKPFWLVGVIDGQVAFVDNSANIKTYVKCVAELKGCIADIEIKEKEVVSFKSVETEKQLDTIEPKSKLVASSIDSAENNKTN